MDEAIAPLDLNSELRSLYIEDMGRCLSEIDEYLPVLEKPLIHYTAIEKAWLVIPSISFKIQANGMDGEFFSKFYGVYPLC